MVVSPCLSSSGISKHLIDCGKRRSAIHLASVSDVSVGVGLGGTRQPSPAFALSCAAVAFGAALRTARKQRGLSQEALCEGADLDRTYPSLPERRLRTPTLAVIFDIAQALGVEPTQLVSDTIARLREKGGDATTTSALDVVPCGRERR